MTHPYVAVWLDHSEAHVFHVDARDFDETTIVSPKAYAQLHRRSGPGAESGHRALGDQHFYKAVSGAVADAQEILVVGPSTAKLELLRYMHRHAHQVAEKIVGVETVDHPTDRQLVAYARHYFGIVDEARA
jgi:stalled ribosome rescue protein Dom34